MAAAPPEAPGRSDGASSSWRDRVVEAVGFDLRSLALARVLVALVFLFGLAWRLPWLEAWYADTGAFPREVILGLPRPAFVWSICFFSGSVAFQALVFAVAAAAGVALLVGWQTRRASGVAWALFLAIRIRNELTSSGADHLLTGLLFAGMFAPWGEHWSLDALRRGVRTIRGAPRFSLGALALGVQAVALFPLSTLSKVGNVWSSGGALEWALRIDYLRLPLGDLLLALGPSALLVLTGSAFLVERFAPLLLVLPWGQPWARSVGLVSLMGLMGGILGSLWVGMFPFVTLAAMSVWVPSAWWARRPLRPLAEVVDRWAAARQPAAPAASWRDDWRLDFLFAAPGAMLLVFGMSVGAAHADVQTRLPDGFDEVGHTLGLSQRWVMFADVARIQAWPAVPATRADGTVVDLWRVGAPAYEEREPVDSRAIWGSPRWAKIFSNLLSLGPLGVDAKRSTLDWLCRRYEHETGRTDVRAIELRVLSVELQEDGGRGPVRAWVLDKGRCGTAPAGASASGDHARERGGDGPRVGAARGVREPPVDRPASPALVENAELPR